MTRCIRCMQGYPHPWCDDGTPSKDQSEWMIRVEDVPAVRRT